MVPNIEGLLHVLFLYIKCIRDQLYLSWEGLRALAPNKSVVKVYFMKDLG